MKIGAGICTFNRETYFKQVFESLSNCNLDVLVVVNDGTPYEFKPDVKLIQHVENKGVTATKNSALNYLLNENCDHIFLIEDDILATSPHVFKEYIHTAQITGLYHLNFGQAAPNQLQFCVNYGSVSADLWRNPQGAFSYFFAPVLRKLGLFDENMKNAFEHIDFTFRLTKTGLLPPFWYFPDVADSTNFLKPIEGSSEQSTITGKKDYQKNWNRSAQAFIQKHGHFTNEIRMVHENEVVASLNRIQTAYGKNEVIPNNLKLQPA